MRIACVYPDRRKWPKFDWVRQALDRLGHTVRHVRTVQELREADGWAERVLFEHKAAGLCIPDLLAIAEQHESYWVQWWFDLVAVEPGKSLDQQDPFRAFGEVMRAMDVCLVRERSLIGDYRALGINATWSDQGCPGDMPACEHQEIPEFDVVLWGSSRGYRQRCEDVRALVGAGFVVAWAGHPGAKPRGVVPLPWCPPERLPELASRAAVVLSADYRHDLDGYWSDRLWLALGMGACVLRRWSPGLPKGTPCHVYPDAGELVALVDRLRGDRAAREALGHQAREWTMSGHTYEHRLREVLSC
jgi:hypothetical protein